MPVQQGWGRQKNCSHEGIVLYLRWSRRWHTHSNEWDLLLALLETVISTGISPFNIWGLYLNFLFIPLHFQEEPQWITLSGYKKGNWKKCQMSLWLFHVISLLFRWEVGVHPTRGAERGDSCLQSLFIRRDCPFGEPQGCFLFFSTQFCFLTS